MLSVPAEPDIASLLALAVVNVNLAAAVLDRTSYPPSFATDPCPATFAAHVAELLHDADTIVVLGRCGRS